MNRYNEIFGGHSEKAPPVPIPNTEVKLLCADGTAWATVWESRSPPIYTIKAPFQIFLDWGFFLCLLTRFFLSLSLTSPTLLQIWPANLLPTIDEGLIIEFFNTVVKDRRDLIVIH